MIIDNINVFGNEVIVDKDWDSKTFNFYLNIENC